MNEEIHSLILPSFDQDSMSRIWRREEVGYWGMQSFNLHLPAQVLSPSIHDVYPIPFSVSGIPNVAVVAGDAHMLNQGYILVYTYLFYLQ